MRICDEHGLRRPCRHCEAEILRLAGEEIDEQTARASAAEARLETARRALEMFIAWCEAEDNSKPYADDNGAAFYARAQLHVDAFDTARAALREIER